MHLVCPAWISLQLLLLSIFSILFFIFLLTFLLDFTLLLKRCLLLSLIIFDLLNHFEYGCKHFWTLKRARDLFQLSHQCLGLQRGCKSLQYVFQKVCCQFLNYFVLLLFFKRTHWLAHDTYACFFIINLLSWLMNLTNHLHL